MQKPLYWPQLEFLVYSIPTSKHAGEWYQRALVAIIVKVHRVGPLRGTVQSSKDLANSKWRLHLHYAYPPATYPPNPPAAYCPNPPLSCSIKIQHMIREGSALAEF